MKTGALILRQFIAWIKGLFQPNEKPEPTIPESHVEVTTGPVTVDVTKQDDGLKAEVKLNALINRAPFYRKVRTDLGPLSQSQLDGFEEFFKIWIRSGLSDLRWFAYMLATAWHETAFTMQPVKEYGGEKYLKSKPYYPYYGRGYVQLTWKANYERYGIAKTPERALEPDVAAHVMIDGMTKGIFTGKSLKDYFGVKSDPVNARRIINGIDKAQSIAKYFETFHTALKSVDQPVEIKVT